MSYDIPQVACRESKIEMDLNSSMEGPSPGEQEHACREAGILANEEWRGDKKSSKKDSMDSGVAGLRDQHLSGNNKSCSGCTDTDSSEIEVSSGKTSYMKGKFLGKGGFAHVHELVDLSTRIVYAGKIIPKNRITKPHHIQKIAREISIHRNLVHKNVVRLHHFFEDNANAYIVLENCSRKSLFHVLKHRYCVTEPEARYYLCQLVEGVKYIHSQKVIHRDLKPGNMLLSEDMVVKLGDFGLATLVDGNKKVSICGTPNYIAPEVLNKLSYSYEADVWAIGCILYAMLVGQPPFETASLKETYSRIVNNKYTIPLTVSENGRKLIRQLLQPQPENRILLEKINSHEFVKSGYTPDTLSPLCCYTAPALGSVLLHRHLIDALTPTDTTSGSSVKAAGNGASVPKQVTQKNALLAKITFKQKISIVLCPDKIGRKKENNALALYHIVVGCLRTMPLPAENTPPVNPTPVTCFPIFVSKWIDYSNKYGFGFQLSDKSVGVLFNDNTRISFNPDRSQVEFHDVHGKVSAHPHNSVPEPLHQRLTVLEYFLRYMQENLTDGGYVNARANDKLKSPILQMKRWVRTNTAIIMELSNGTLQINFFKDHTKIIISAGKHGYLVTYINGERQSCSYWLHQIAQVGCEKNISSRLKFAAAVLREFAELDGELV